eukprot:evm.model.scf_437EXC.13 EVM.evm.TU.scf_437EXC.13   scf_437EXC:72061-74967(-)
MHTTTGRPLAPRGVTSPLNCRLPGVRLRCPPRGCTTGRQATFGPADVESLIPDTLEDMAQDAEFQRTAERLRREGQAALTREERMKRQRSLDNLGVPSFYKMVQDGGVTTLKRSPAKIFQLNIGLYCNQACTHCHVESSPKRTEMMSKETADRCIELLKSCHTVNTLDITGGAPELNSQFRYLVKEAAELGIDIIDRCNLTVLLEPGQEDLPQFLADHKVHVVASLPCYSEKNVNKQRGAGVFERSIWGLQALNRLGYGQEGTGLNLDLVYNPGGPSLAPPQATLEAAYKQELMDAHGIEFNRCGVKHCWKVVLLGSWNAARIPKVHIVGRGIPTFCAVVWWQLLLVGLHCPAEPQVDMCVCVACKVCSLLHASLLRSKAM